jgi:hypothetical protein
MSFSEKNKKVNSMFEKCAIAPHESCAAAKEVLKQKN